MKQFLAAILIIGIFLNIQPNVTFAAKEVTKFQVPDVTDKFCGPVMQAAFCQCAFHDNSCDVMKMSQEQAFTFVDNEFRSWVAGLIKVTAEQCIANDGYWNTATRQCIRCTDGDVRSGNKCLAPGSEAEPEEAGQCRALTEFGKDWKKYSDFDSAIPVNDASFEVKEYNQVLDVVARKIAEAEAIEYDMEVDRQIRLDLREYKQTLVDNIRDNITKAIFRLAWVTYNTVKGAEGAAGSYRTLVNPDNAVEALGAGLKTVQGAIPADQKQLQFDTSTTEGKVKSGAWNATLEVLESVADPKAVAVQTIKDVRGAAVPGPDLTEEEVGILRKQHLDNLAVDKALAESYAENAERRQKLLTLKKEIATLYNEMEDWRGKEYARIKSEIESSCQK
jgi:hypothetical protein